MVHVHASVNRDTGTGKATKTGDARRVTLERELLPLLRAIQEETGGRGVIAPVRATDRKLSRQLRRCLALAGVTRAELSDAEALCAAGKAGRVLRLGDEMELAALNRAMD